MNFLQKLFTVGKVLRAGESLQDPASWKNRQMAMSAILVILGAVPQFVDINVSESDLNAVSYGIAALLGVLNTYFTSATSDKVGLPAKVKD